jgi:hypothetical protein
MIDVQAGEPIAIRRRMFFDVRQADGISPALGEDGQQPQISIDGDGAWTNAGIGTLVAIGHGRYYADVTAGTLVAGSTIEARYARAGTAETPSEESFRVVAFDPFNIVSATASRITTDHGAGAYNGAGVITGVAPGDQVLPIDAAISHYVGTTFDKTFQVDAYDSTGWSEFDFTIKRDGAGDDDRNAMILIRKTSGGVGSGLIVVGGQPAAVAGDASITVNLAGATTTIAVSIAARAMRFDPSPEGSPYSWEITRWRGLAKDITGLGTFEARRGVRRDVDPAAVSA